MDDELIETKYCMKCKQRKPLDDFSKCSRSRDKRQHYCKLCHRSHQKEWKARPGSVRMMRANYLMYNYNLSILEEEDMLIRQDYKCKSCGYPFEGTPHVDHNHITGETRDLLCHGCNTGIGLAKEDMKRLRGMVSYGERWEFSV